MNYVSVKTVKIRRRAKGMKRRRRRGKGRKGRRGRKSKVYTCGKGRDSSGTCAEWQYVFQLGK